MLQICNSIFGAERFEWVFDIPIEEAQDKLHSKVGKMTLSSFFSGGMVGTIDGEKVRIQRVVPMVGNSFKPFLIGKLTTDSRGTILSGVFRMHRFVQMFLIYWFGFLLFALIPATREAFEDPSQAWFSPLLLCLMLVLGFGLVRLGKWFSRNDKEWLKESVSSAIGSHNK